MQFKQESSQDRKEYLDQKRPLSGELRSMEAGSPGQGPTAKMQSQLHQQMSERMNEKAEKPISSHAANYASQNSESSSQQNWPSIGSYSVLSEIGRGSFATVFLAVHTPHNSNSSISSPTKNSLSNDASPVKYVAIKSVSTKRINKKLAENLESEIAILKSIHHQNIVALFDIIKTEAQIHLVCEYCSLGDMSLYIKKKGMLHSKPGPSKTGSTGYNPYLNVWGGLNEFVVAQFLKQIASAMECLRSQSLIHRDLKPQNLLLSQPRDYRKDTPASPQEITHNHLPIIKLADFGFARPLSMHSLASTLCGSPLYMAPEILKGDKYDAKADLWSIGAILYELLCGRPPFKASNHVELLHKIEKCEGVKFPGESSSHQTSLNASKKMIMMVNGQYPRQSLSHCSPPAYPVSPLHPISYSPPSRRYPKHDITKQESTNMQFYDQRCSVETNKYGISAPNPRPEGQGNYKMGHRPLSINTSISTHHYPNPSSRQSSYQHPHQLPLNSPLNVPSHYGSHFTSYSPSTNPSFNPSQHTLYPSSHHSHYSSHLYPSHDPTVSPTDGTCISLELKDVIQKLLQRIPNDRISFEDFFAHPCLTTKSSNRAIDVPRQVSTASHHFPMGHGTTNQQFPNGTTLGSSRSSRDSTASSPMKLLVRRPSNLSRFSFSVSPNYQASPYEPSVSRPPSVSYQQDSHRTSSNPPFPDPNRPISSQQRIQSTQNSQESYRQTQPESQVTSGLYVSTHSGSSSNSSAREKDLYQQDFCGPFSLGFKSDSRSIDVSSKNISQSPKQFSKNASSSKEPLVLSENQRNASLTMNSSCIIDGALSKSKTVSSNSKTSSGLGSVELNDFDQEDFNESEGDAQEGTTSMQEFNQNVQELNQNRQYLTNPSVSCMGRERREEGESPSSRYSSIKHPAKKMDQSMTHDFVVVDKGPVQINWVADEAILLKRQMKQGRFLSLKDRNQVKGISMQNEGNPSLKARLHAFIVDDLPFPVGVPFSDLFNEKTITTENIQKNRFTENTEVNTKMNLNPRVESLMKSIGTFLFRAHFVQLLAKEAIHENRISESPLRTHATIEEWKTNKESFHLYLLSLALYQLALDSVMQVWQDQHLLVKEGLDMTRWIEGVQWIREQFNLVLSNAEDVQVKIRMIEHELKGRGETLQGKLAQTLLHTETGKGFSQENISEFKSPFHVLYDTALVLCKEAAQQELAMKKKSVKGNRTDDPAIETTLSPLNGSASGQKVSVPPKKWTLPRKISVSCLYIEALTYFDVILAADDHPSDQTVSLDEQTRLNVEKLMTKVYSRLNGLK